MDHRPQTNNYRTGRLQKCNCTGPPYPYELEGPNSTIALEATVLRAAFRKHNSDVRSRLLVDNGSWDLPLNHEEFSPPPEDLTRRLPMEILDQILTMVYNATQTSNDICTCSRRNTPYKIIRSRSLKHRVTDSFALRLTCSRWHEWALKYILSGVIGGEFIELDISNLSSFDNMRLPVGGLAERLAQDFPFLGNMGITLYLGNPGEICNMILVKEMLDRTQGYGGDFCQIFSGVSFWDLDYTVKDALPRWAWNVDSLILLDILSYFSTLQIPTRVQFPTTLFATLPQKLWRPVLKDLLRYADKLSLREFQVKQDPPIQIRQRHRDRNRNRNWDGLPQDPFNPHIDLLLLEIFQRNRPIEPDSITRHCKELHGAVSLGPKEDWEQLRHLSLNLKSFHERQDWRIDNAFLEKFSFCDLNRLVSVIVDGGLASRLTIDGLLKLLEPSSNTLQRLVFRPIDADAGIEVRHTKHHCQILSPSNMGKKFPRLEEMELHIPCCPDIFLSDNCWSLQPNLKRHWRIQIPCTSSGFMGFCQSWIDRNLFPRNATGLVAGSWKWNHTALSILFEAARIGRSHLLAGEIKQVNELEGQVSSAYDGGLDLGVGYQCKVRAPATDTAEKQSLVNKWVKISDMWQLEIRMKNVSISSYTNPSVHTNLVFYPLALPQPKVRLRTIECVVGERVNSKRFVKLEMEEGVFLKGIGESHIAI